MQIQDIQDDMIFKCLTGSRAYGTNHAESDWDYKGVFRIDPKRYFYVNSPPEQVANSKQDETYYTLLRFLHLAINANPNILEMLFMPQDCVQISTEMWEKIIAIRDAFISKRVLHTYGGYAAAQIKKARGQNKLINNPMPEKKPVKEDFCWIVPMSVASAESLGCDWDAGGALCAEYLAPEKQPFRPQRVSEFPQRTGEPGLDLSPYHASAIEHIHDAYRLYDYGEKSKGVFRGDDMLVCESIPIDDEREKFAGILIYNKDAFDRELRLWHQYWDWKQNRNESRWRDQENMENPVDYKNMMHCIRLLCEGEHILETGRLIVRFSGDALQRLKDIRAGKIPYEDLVQEADDRLQNLDNLAKTCSLPKNADYDRVSKLSVELHEQ
jgi:predicted nucleotidyltransferase